MMKLRPGHFVVLALIGLMTAINGYLVVFVSAPPQPVPEVVIPEPPHFVALVKEPVERPVPVRPYSTTVFVDNRDFEALFNGETIPIDGGRFFAYGCLSPLYLPEPEDPSP